MRTETNGFFTEDEDWVIGMLYMTPQEIRKKGLIPNSYNGGDYDWITMPPRDDGSKECLVAAYGGLASEIAQRKTHSTDLGVAYYQIEDESPYDAFDSRYLKKEIATLVIDTQREAVAVYDPIRDAEYRGEQLYMNPNTGSVDTLDGWGFSYEKDAIEDGLVAVFRNRHGEWEEV